MYWIPDPEHPVTKVCSRCGEEKHLMEFYLNYQEGRRRAGEVPGGVSRPDGGVEPGLVVKSGDSVRISGCARGHPARP